MLTIFPQSPGQQGNFSSQAPSDRGWRAALLFPVPGLVCQKAVRLHGREGGPTHNVFQQGMTFAGAATGAQPLAGRVALAHGVAAVTPQLPLVGKAMRISNDADKGRGPDFSQTGNAFQSQDRVFSALSPAPQQS